MILLTICLIGINYNGVDYYYRKNLQGDIECIYSEAGNKVVTYTYDAWGNTTSITGTMATSLGVKNPFRYRSYYFDTETGLYYLQSRYYDPQVGRFLNGDEPVLIRASGTLLSNNLYSYCENNPVNNIDPTGFWKFSINTTVAGIALELFIMVILPYIFTAFNATKLVKWAKTSRWFKGIYKKASKWLAKQIYNGMDRIMYNIMGKAANAATRSFTLSGLENLIGSILTFSIGYSIAWILDCFDSDGLSGYIRY